MVIKICPKCKENFECQGGNCWCKKVKISENKLKILQTKYKDCLCPRCLVE